MKELGQMWQVDYSDINNLRTSSRSTLPSSCMTASSTRPVVISRLPTPLDKMVVVDTKERKLEAMIDVGKKTPSGSRRQLERSQVRTGRWHHSPGRRYCDCLGYDPAKRKDTCKSKVCYTVEN